MFTKKSCIKFYSADVYSDDAVNLYSGATLEEALRVLSKNALGRVKSFRICFY